MEMRLTWSKISLPPLTSEERRIDEHTSQLIGKRTGGEGRRLGWRGENAAAGDLFTETQTRHRGKEQQNQQPRKRNHTIDRTICRLRGKTLPEHLNFSHFDAHSMPCFFAAACSSSSPSSVSFPLPAAASGSSLCPHTTNKAMREAATRERVTNSASRESNFFRLASRMLCRSLLSALSPALPLLCPCSAAALPALCTSSRITRDDGVGRQIATAVSLPSRFRSVPFAAEAGHCVARLLIPQAHKPDTSCNVFAVTEFSYSLSAASLTLSPC